MTAEKKKRNFRNSKKWKEFRHTKYIEQNGECFLSGKKLNKMANLHHLDMSDENYEDLTNYFDRYFWKTSVFDLYETFVNEQRKNF